MTTTHRLPVLETAISALLATSSVGLAQTPTAEAEPSVPEASTEPAAAALPAAEPVDAAAAPEPGAPPEAVPSPPAAEATTEPAAAEPDAESAPVPSYFRIDHDYLFGLQLWAGATYPFGDSVGLASDIYIAENYPSQSATDGTLSLLSWWGEFDVGPAFTLGPVSLTPMVGIAFDWAARKAVAINGPQLYTIVSTDSIYFESWVWTLLYSAFDKGGANDYIHTRDWLLYKFNDTIALGPQLEYTYDLEDKSTLAFPLGGHVELAYGTGNSLGLFLGYELKKSLRQAADGAGAEGRLTFVHSF
ncbi:MAG: hypothetical protein JW940_22590 [Polyangiaceae bacterium]|nr:hypothetical protein [Polyangiaceae bacterium]